MDGLGRFFISLMYFSVDAASDHNNDFQYLSWREFQHEVHGFIRWQRSHVWRNLEHAVIVQSPRHLR